jgi:quercetin dioxygenase-like cupin family protein
LVLFTKDLSILEISLEPNATSGLHLHSLERETFIVQSGEINFLIGKENFTASAGQVVTIEPHAVHCFSNTSASLARAILILNPGGLAQYFLDLQALLIARASASAISELGQEYGLEFFSA